MVGSSTQALWDTRRNAALEGLSSELLITCILLTLNASPLPASPQKPTTKPNLDATRADLHTARTAIAEVEAVTTIARQRLADTTEKRREEETRATLARQRATELAREVAELTATAASARQQGAGGKEAAAAARSELADLREATDKERRALERFRDASAELEAEAARQKERTRFAREAAEAQQARLDDLKREVRRGGGLGGHFFQVRGGIPRGSSDDWGKTGGS